MNILLGIGGGIAAYKTPHLVRLLVASGHQVRVCLSTHANQFVTALSLQAVSGHPVYQHQFPPANKDGMEHISLARWADSMLVAPASASIIARLACGFADDLLTTMALVHTGKKLLAPAMNQSMWGNAAVQNNLQTLTKHGWQILPVDSGEQACGETGEGRMLQPKTLVRLLNQQLGATNTPGSHWWQGKKLLMTAGPTYETIDPVRFIGNHSSGKMGYALAAAAAKLGARVTLVSGPVNLPDPPGVNTIRVGSAAEMHAATTQITDWEVCIGAAAVADYTPTQQHQHKIHKQDQQVQLSLTKTPDIIADLAAKKTANQQLVVGFCAETQDKTALLARARSKLVNKKLDLVVANQVGEKLVFDQDTAALWLVHANGEQALPAASKDTQAAEILTAMSTLFPTP